MNFLHPTLSRRFARCSASSPPPGSTTSPPPRARFDIANAAYRARFGFPFVICARDRDQAPILAALERRANDDDRAAEVATALEEIAKIARLRREDAVTA